MRIIHVVALVSDKGAYGGPLRVALNQVRELRSRGHEVELMAGWHGKTSPPALVDGVNVSLHRTFQVLPAGFSGLFSPSLYRSLLAKAAQADLVHVHAGRDATSMTAIQAVRHAGTPYVLQTHGMIVPDGRPKAIVLDALFTRRYMRESALRVVLTELERSQVLSLVSGHAVEILRNGIQMPHAMRANDEGQVSVVFCARMHARKRPLAFVEMAALLHERYPSWRFSMIGPDEGELGAVLERVTRLGLDGVVNYEGSLPYEAVLNRIRRASLYVLPSVNEPFPMSLLEALSLGVASICTESCGISRELDLAGAALVSDGSPENLAFAAARVMNEPGLRSKLEESAARVAESHFSIQASVDRLESLYEGVVHG